MEPEWTKKNISNNTICSYYYVIFVIIAIAAIMAVIGAFVVPFIKGISPGMKALQIVTFIIQAIIGVAGSLAAYLMCDRALKPTSRVL